MPPPKDILTFMQRWRSKSESYKLDRLDSCFDGFFSTFVLYNFLYDYICQEDERRFPETRDGERSVNVAPRFLGASAISSDAAIMGAAKKIKHFVEQGAFYLRDDEWDAERVKGLDSANSEEWAKNLLQTVYRIRCNTFHGRKAFCEEQKAILVPCITILQRLNDLLMEQLAPGTLTKLNRNDGKRGGSSDEETEPGAAADREGM